MIELYSPENEAELLILRSIFDAEGINYYVLNDYFGTMRCGPKIDLLNAKKICVSEEDSEFAKEIISDFLQNVRDATKPFKSQYSVLDKIRMVIEAIVFGWFMPGNKWGHKELDEEI